MNDCENLLKATIFELEKLLTSKTVVAEPVTSEGTTVVPLLSVSLGFGAGAGPAKEGSAGTGGGAGGGFKMKPVAVIVIEKDRVRVESVEKNREAKYPIIESVLEKLPQILKKELKDREEGRGELEHKEEDKKDTGIRID